MTELEFNKLMLDIYTWQIRGDFVCQRKGINNQQAQVLARVLKSNPFITSIDLSGNLIGDPGLQALKTCFCPDCPRLTTINLAGNQITSINAIQPLPPNTRILFQAEVQRASPLPRRKKSVTQTIKVHSSPMNLAVRDQLRVDNIKLTTLSNDVIHQPFWNQINTKNLTEMFRRLAERYKKLQEKNKPFIHDILTNAKPRKLAMESYSKYVEEIAILLDGKTIPKLSIQALRLTSQLKRNEITDILCAITLLGIQDIFLISPLIARVAQLLAAGQLNHQNLTRIFWAIPKLGLPKETMQKLVLSLWDWIDLKRPLFTLKELLKIAVVLINIDLPTKEKSEILAELLDEISYKIDKITTKPNLKTLLDCKEAQYFDYIIQFSIKNQPALINSQAAPTQKIILEIAEKKRLLPNKMRSKSPYYTLAGIQKLFNVIDAKLGIKKDPVQILTSQSTHTNSITAAGVPITSATTSILSAAAPASASAVSTATASIAAPNSSNTKLNHEIKIAKDVQIVTPEHTELLCFSYNPNYKTNNIALTVAPQRLGSKLDNGQTY